MVQIKNGVALTTPQGTKGTTMKKLNSSIVQYYTYILNSLILLSSTDLEYCPMCEISHENNTNCQR